MDRNMDPDPFNPDWIAVAEEEPFTDEEVEDEVPLPPMYGDEELDPEVDLPPMRDDDDPFWDTEEDSEEEDQHESDRPLRHPAIDITEMVPPDCLGDCNPADSGFVDGHLPTNIESGLLAGRSYPTWEAFDRVLDEYEAMAGSRFVRKSRNKKRLIAECRGGDKGNPDACKAKFSVRHLVASGRVSVQKSHLIHTCPQGIHVWRNGAHKRRWVEEKVEATIRVNQDTSNKTLRGNLRETYNADTTPWTAQRARSRVVKRIGGDQASSFSMIPSYVEKVRLVDPETHIHYQTYEYDHRFRRIYMAPSSSQKAFPHVRPFVGLDATHSGGEFPMIVLLATTFDCNNHILLLAWAVVGVENKDNWIWFMEYLDTSYPRMRSERFTIIVSDRDKGLKEGVSQVWTHMYHSFCTRHLRANVITKSDMTMGNFFFDEVARAIRESDYKRLLDEYKPLNSRQEEGLKYIRGINPKLYARHAFPVPRWGHTTSNVVEILNGVFKDIRRRPTLRICKDLWDYTMQKHFSRLETAKTWLTGENALTAHATVLLNTLYQRAGGVEERPSSKTQALMCDTKGEWALDMELRLCECKEWQEMGFPCVHAVKFCRNRGLDEKMYIDDIWKAQSQVLAYSINLPPISLGGLKMDKKECREPLIVPSNKKVARSMKRRASRFEKILANERLAVKQHHKCKEYGMEGHNKRGCPIPHQRALARMMRDTCYMRVCAIHTMDHSIVGERGLFWESRPTPKMSFSQWYEEVFPSTQQDSVT